MHWGMLIIRGLRREKGPAQRKLPITVEDLNDLRGMLVPIQIDHAILRASVLIGRFLCYG